MSSRTIRREVRGGREPFLLESNGYASSTDTLLAWPIYRRQIVDDQFSSRGILNLSPGFVLETGKHRRGNDIDPSSNRNGN